jgi:phospholipase C
MRLRVPMLGIAVVAVAALAATASGAARTHSTHGARPFATSLVLPGVKHIVVIYQENASFDHMFGTYPVAKNPPGEPAFHAAAGTPHVNGLSGPLLTANPNGANPQRLDRYDYPLCDLSHEYDPEIREWDGGKMDRFVAESIDYSRSDTPGAGYGSVPAGVTGGVTDRSCATPIPGHTTDQATNKEVMDYYDGNTVTAWWNYAQHGTLFDESFGTTFGPSTPGAINLVSGQTSGLTVPVGSDDLHSCADINWLVTLGLDCFVPANTSTPFVGDGDIRSGTVVGDPDPAYDDCASTNTVALTGQNIGDLLNAKHVTWGWFEGGFRPTTKATATSPAVCASAHAVMNPVHPGVPTKLKKDYVAHHEPFQYYASTANAHHLAPTSVKAIGHTDRANHQYDLTDFYAALHASNLPSVTFLKAPAYQDGHPDYSGPLDEQRFIVNAVNAIEASHFWKSTAIIVAEDDSDGFYDHIAPPIVNYDSEMVPGPTVNGIAWPANACQPPAGQVTLNLLGTATGRCGYGPRLPLLIISPWAKHNWVDHSLTDQTSILRLIEDQFLGGQRIGGGSFDAIAGSLASAFTTHPNYQRIYLSPSTGEIIATRTH